MFGVIVEVKVRHVWALGLAAGLVVVGMGIGHSTLRGQLLVRLVLASKKVIEHLKILKRRNFNLGAKCIWATGVGGGVLQRRHFANKM